MFYFDKRMLYGLLIIMAIMELTQLGGTTEILMKILTIPGVLIAITFHEFAHGYAATKLGDSTPKDQGRLSLNPFAHLDPIGTFMLLFAGFGWGKSVQINPRNFNRDIPMAKAEAIVSVAGPLMNFVLAIISAIIYSLLVKFAPGVAVSFVGVIVQYTIVINIGLGIFNLIPLPPLDGSKILKNFLSYNARNWIENKEYYFYIGFVLLWLTGALGMIISPLIQIVTSLIFKLVGLG